MTREEEIIQMSKKTALEDWHEGQAGYFEAKEYLRKGAEWADEHPREGLWDAEKVIDWLKENSKKYVVCYEDGYSHYAHNSMIDDFKNYIQNESEK